MTENNKFILPKIPGRIYSAVYIDKYLLLFGMPVFLYFVIPLLMDPKISSVIFIKYGIMFGISFLAIGFRAFSKSMTVAADISETSVSAQFTNNRTAINNDLLENYKLQLDKLDQSRAYRYGASLVRIDEKKQPRIVLADKIFCPVKLKEWVESFQSQIANPLPITFSSPEVESDYNSGIYMSMKKSVRK